MEEAKRCDRKTALKKLYSGVFVFTKDFKDIYKDVHGCENCQAKRTGNYCNNCGDKLVDNLKVKVKTEVTEYRFKYHKDSGKLRTEVKGESGFYIDTDFVPSFEFFLNRTYWSWIW